MNFPSASHQPSAFFRYKREIKESVAILLILAFGTAYWFVPALNSIVDTAVTPAVAGITVLYGKISTLIHKKTGVNVGFVSVSTDQDFLLSVRLATYVNERRASPLFDIAVDNRLPQDHRARALLAVLKFESSADWVQPFLNELPKGGLLGLYDENPILLNAIIQKIRSEGGIRQPLVRAYAEVVFAFMLQLPDLVVRRHACRWLSDVLAEDAIFLLIPRFEKEKDNQARADIEQALYDIRAVSEPATARELLLPYFRQPPWPGLKQPLGLVLARLGDTAAIEFARKQVNVEDLTQEKRVLFRVAATTLYPRQLTVSESDRRALAERRRERDEQQKQAYHRREQIMREERTKQLLIARAQTATETKPKPAAEQPKILQQEKPASVAAHQPETTAMQKPAATQTVEKQEKTPPKAFPIAVSPDTSEESAATSATSDQPEAVSDESIPQIASLPDEYLPPTLEEPAMQPKSLMNYVDVIFEVKGKDAPLYQNPGEGETATVLPVGTKGKADFEVLIGEDKWYQVKTKLGNGWANAKNLSAFNLAPGNVKPATASKPKSTFNPDAGRKESTYFQASLDNVPIFDKPSDSAKQIGTLQPDIAYLAVRSEKVGADRWFLLQIRAGETAWCRGLDLQLADVKQPSGMEIPSDAGEQTEQKSAFEAEWIKASVKGVGVYKRPSIAATMMTQIHPPTVYRVLETSAGGGSEWYRIELSSKKEGWVQTMDVTLTKPDSK